MDCINQTSLHLQQFFLHLRYTGEAYGLVLDFTLAVNNEITWDTFHTHRIAQVSPLLVRHAEVLAVDVRNHVLPSALRRGFARDIDIDDVLFLQVLLHRKHLLVGHAARTAPCSPEIHQQYLAAKLADDGCKEVFISYLARFIHTETGLFLIGLDFCQQLVVGSR